MSGDVHAQFGAVPSFEDSAFLGAIDVHAQDRLKGELEHLLPRHVRELRIGEGERKGLMVSVLHIAADHGVALEGKDIEVVVEGFALAGVEDPLTTL